MGFESESEIPQIRPSNDSIDIDAEAQSPHVEPIDMQGVPLSYYPVQPNVVMNEPTRSQDLSLEYLYPKFDDMRFPRIALILFR